MRISDWSSDVCSSDLWADDQFLVIVDGMHAQGKWRAGGGTDDHDGPLAALLHRLQAKHILQVNHGMPQVATSGDPRPAYAGNAQRLIVIMQNLHHRRARYGEIMPPRTHDQARNDGEGQRHPNYD